MKITRRQLRRIIREDTTKTPQLERAVLDIFYAEGRVTMADVFDRLRMEGLTDFDIDALMVDAGL